jgi:hypothetical protein
MKTRGPVGMLFRVFFSDKRNIFVMIVIGLLVMSVGTIVLSASDCYLTEKVNSVDRRFGKSVLSVESDDAGRLLDAANENMVQDSILCRAEYYDDGVNRYFEEYYATEDILAMTALTLVNGRFPEEENEIAVSEYYLLEKGIAARDMIGSRVNLVREDKEYIVTGVLRDEVASGGSSVLEFRVVHPPIKENNTVFLEVKNKREIESFYAIMDSKYSDCVLRVSIGQVSMLTNEEGETIFEKIDQIRIAMLCVVVAYTAVIVLLFSRLAHERNKKNMAVLQLIGVGRRQIHVVFLSFQLVLYTVGCIPGILLGEIVGSVFCHSRLGWSITEYWVKCPFGLLLLCYGMCVAAIVLLQLPAIVSEGRKSGAEVFRREVGARKKTGSLFQKTNKGYRSIMVIKNLSEHRGLSFFMLAGFVLSGGVLVVAGYFAHVYAQQKITRGNAPDYAVYETLDQGDETGFENAMTEQLLGELSDSVHRMDYYVTTCDSKVPEECLGKGMKELLSQDMEQRRQLMTQSKVECRVSIVAYDNETIEQVSRKENTPPIGDGEAWVYRYNSSVRKFAAENNFKKGDTLDICWWAADNSRSAKLKIQGVFDTLPVLLDSGEGDILVVLSRSYFETLFPDVERRAVYLYADGLTSEDEEILLRMYQIPGLLIERPKEDLQNAKEQERTIQIVVVAGFVSLILMSFFLVAGNVFVGVVVRETEFCTYMAIGETPLGITQIAIGHCVIICCASVIVSSILSWLTTRFMFSRAFGNKYLPFYQFPVGLLFLSVFAMLLVLLGMAIPVCAEYRNKRIMEVLKASGPV